MKKLMMFVLLLLGLACAAGGYYLFIYKQDEVIEEPVEVVEETPAVEIEEEAPVLDLESMAPRIKEYYVAEPRIGVRESRNEDAFAERELFRAEKVVVLEELEGWGRISAYFVYHEGGDEVAEWVKLDELQEQPPEISKKERYETVALSIQGSDDYLQYKDDLTKYSDQLIEQKTCDLLDFEESDGWMRSINYSDRQVYFVYCGGLRPADKVYLDVLTGEIFYP
ncbi:hypothetical protein ACPV5L_16115 [Vibrio astriarenae]